MTKIAAPKAPSLMELLRVTRELKKLAAKRRKMAEHKSASSKTN
jgi:hypothetical protein